MFNLSITERVISSIFAFFGGLVLNCFWEVKIVPFTFGVVLFQVADHVIYRVRKK